MTTDVKRSRQAASGSNPIEATSSLGYGYHPLARALTSRITAAAEAPTRIQSFVLSGAALSEVRGPEPKPLASIDSASWIEPSTLVRTTGTTTSAQDRGPRGFPPRRR